MKLFQSIRFRIVMACIIFSLIVTLCYGWVTFYGVKYNSDELFNWYISQEASKLIDSYNADANVNLSEMTTAHVMVSDEKSALNKALQFFPNSATQSIFKNSATLDDVNIPGPRFTTAQGYIIYEFTADGRTIHILKSALTNELKKYFYYIVDVSDFVNYDNHSEEYILEIFINFLILILCLALLIGFFLAKMVISPLTRLANSVDCVDHQHYAKKQETYFNDEIGFLAKKIDSFVDRTNQFVLREKAFSRDASHELRTPVASSRAALELAMSLKEGQTGKMSQFLQRIHRANRDMTHLIETFLMLGKEDKEQASESSFSLYKLVDNAFQKHDYLKKSANIQCVNNVDTHLNVNGAEQLLSIVIDNLIRNALQHTYQGSITVYNEGTKILIKDSGEGMDDESGSRDSTSVLEKSGVGLSLVRRLSEKQGWHVEITSLKGEGTCVSVTL